MPNQVIDNPTLEKYAKTLTVEPHDLDDYPLIRDFVKVNMRQLHKTGQQIADEADLPFSTVSKYLSGATAGASAHTVGRVCAAARFDLNAYFGITPIKDPTEAQESPDVAELRARLHELELENEHLRETKQMQAASIERLAHANTFRAQVADFRGGLVKALGAVCVALMAAVAFYLYLDSKNPQAGVFQPTPNTVGVILLSAVAVACVATVVLLIRGRHKHKVEPGA